MNRFVNLLLVSGLALTCGTASAANKDLILGTTTSTQDSGLLDILIPVFEKTTGFKVKTIAVGTGEAIAMGIRGEADVLLVHSPDDEIKFVSDGFGINRKLVMHNDFVIVGPKENPAKIKGKNVLQALKNIVTAKSIFVSRADNSGTHKKEIKLWKKVETKPKKENYIETGQGMAETLKIADYKSAYTLTDRSTYLALKKTLNLVILVEGEKELFNQYGVIEVNPAKFPKVNSVAAKAFSNFITCKKTQKTIGDFGKDKYGEPLFFPDNFK